MSDIPNTSVPEGQSVGNGTVKSSCPPAVLQAIYGTIENKTAEYENSLRRWWVEYADRKNDEEEEHVANSLLYDRRHLPRTAPPPECVMQPGTQQAAQQPGPPAPSSTA